MILTVDFVNRSKEKRKEDVEEVQMRKERRYGGRKGEGRE